MAVPETTFLFIGLLAVGASVGSFMNFDRPTRVIISLFSTALWFIFAFSAYQVEVIESATSKIYSIEPLAYVGFGSAIVMVMFFFHHALSVLREGTEEWEGADLT